MCVRRWRNLKGTGHCVSVVVPCTGTKDNQCSTCNSGYYITADFQCARCSNAVCGANECQTGICTGNSNQLRCSTCSNAICTKPNEYRSGSCKDQGEEEYSCNTCSNIKCGSGFFRSGTGGSVRRILRAHQTSTYGALVQALGVNAKTGPGVQAHLTFRVPRPQPRGPVWIARSVHVRSTSPTPPLGRRALAAVSRSAAPRSTCRGQHQTQQAYAWTSRHARRTNSLRGVPQQRVVHARCTPPVPRTSTSPSLPPSAGHAPTPRAAAAWNAG